MVALYASPAEPFPRVNNRDGSIRVIWDGSSINVGGILRNEAGRTENGPGGAARRDCRESGHRVSFGLGRGGVSENRCLTLIFAFPIFSSRPRRARVTTTGNPAAKSRSPVARSRRRFSGSASTPQRIGWPLRSDWPELPRWSGNLSRPALRSRMPKSPQRRRRGGRRYQAASETVIQDTNQFLDDRIGEDRLALRVEQWQHDAKKIRVTFQAVVCETG